jgi:hypothetical protein
MDMTRRQLAKRMGAAALSGLTASPALSAVASSEATLPVRNEFVAGQLKLSS